MSIQSAISLSLIAFWIGFAFNDKLVRRQLRRDRDQALANNRPTNREQA